MFAAIGTVLMIVGAVALGHSAAAMDEEPSALQLLAFAGSFGVCLIGAAVVSEGILRSDR